MFFLIDWLTRAIYGDDTVKRSRRQRSKRRKR